LPYAELSPNGELIRRYSRLLYEPLVPFIRHSGFANELDWALLARQEGRSAQEHGHEIARRLVDEFGLLSRRNGIRPVLAQISGLDMVDFARQHGFSAVAIEVDYRRPEMRLSADDGHPSAKAHRIFAGKLLPLFWTVSPTDGAGAMNQGHSAP
jgi:hypothetical protein